MGGAVGEAVAEGAFVGGASSSSSCSSCSSCSSVGEAFGEAVVVGRLCAVGEAVGKVVGEVLGEAVCEAEGRPVDELETDTTGA